MALTTWLATLAANFDGRFSIVAVVAVVGGSDVKAES